ncbi:phosphomannomutase/phosphoglucomutase [Campylobacter sp. RM12647]|uniref:phosphomannomutase/phosphoglucomutase n=1 Tax=Campylobacter sp. RM12647 TaxID=2735737 RepID=UPI001DF2A623|nr:phosphomannomutase/phosphoglucomutase [Campylobacter sp. RM12647]
MKHIFREYDIRGIFGTEISPSFTKALGFVIGKIMLSKNAKSVSVGYDARLSNKVLNNALIYGLNRAGIKVYSLGLVPTPLGYFSNYAYEIDANIMITASHNPKEYNGFKITINKESFFAKELSDIYTEVANHIKDFDDKIENAEYEELDIKTKYIEFLQKEFAHLKNANINLAIDTASGAACEVVANILDILNIKYAHYFSEFDGEFKSHEPDPTEEENLFAIKNELNFSNFSHHCPTPLYKNNYVKNTATLGFGFDGDADRIVCVLKDKIIKGDELCYLFANNIKNPKILCEVKCSKVIFDKINELGTCSMCKTGHSNIKKAIKELNVDLAAELSGHVFFNDKYYGYDDAIYSMLRIIELYLKNPNFIDILNNLPKAYSSNEIKIKVNENDKFNIINTYKEKIKSLNLNAKLIEIDGVRLEFENGFSLLRASNTSPYLVARFESISEDKLKEINDFTFKLLDEIIKN